MLLTHFDKRIDNELFANLGMSIFQLCALRIRNTIFQLSFSHFGDLLMSQAWLPVYCELVVGRYDGVLLVLFNAIACLLAQPQS